MSEAICVRFQNVVTYFRCPCITYGFRMVGLREQVQDLVQGSSGSLVATESWFEVKFSAEEEDSNSVVLEGLESSGVGLDGLDAAVETFSV